jgi:hypothetical protein
VKILQKYRKKSQRDYRKNTIFNYSDTTGFLRLTIDENADKIIMI